MPDGNLDLVSYKTGEKVEVFYRVTHNANGYIPVCSDGHGAMSPRVGVRFFCRRGRAEALKFCAAVHAQMDGRARCPGFRLIRAL